MKFFLSDGYTFGFRFKQKYPNKQPWIKLGLAGKPHLGTDLICNGRQGTATLRGRGEYVYGPGGGHQLYFYPEGRNHLIRFLHLKSKLTIKTGQINVGDKVFITGNSGDATTTPHLHCDIWNLDNGPLNLNNINGFLDPQNYDWVQATTMLKQQNLIIKHNVISVGYFNQVIDYALNWIAQTTNGELTVAVDIVDRPDRPLNVISGSNTDGAPVVYIDPNQVAALGSEIKAQNNKNYAIVTLAADYSRFNPKPTFDEAFAMWVDGFTISEIDFEIEFNDVKNRANFLIHEWLHNWYFILQQKGIPVIDDVHQHSTIDDPRPDFNFADIVLKLKPHWPLLAGPAQGDTMDKTVVFAKRGTNLKAILQEENWVGFADVESYNKHIAGTQVVELVLDAAEFDKLVIKDVIKK